MRNQYKVLQEAYSTVLEGETMSWQDYQAAQQAAKELKWKQQALSPDKRPAQDPASTSIFTGNREINGTALTKIELERPQYAKDWRNPTYLPKGLKDIIQDKIDAFKKGEFFIPLESKHNSLEGFHIWEPNKHVHILLKLDTTNKTLEFRKIFYPYGPYQNWVDADPKRRSYYEEGY